jgi:hypothetical protein
LAERLERSLGATPELIANCATKSATLEERYWSLSTCWGGNTHRYLPLWWLNYQFFTAGLYFPADGTEPVVCLSINSTLRLIAYSVEDFSRRPKRWLKSACMDKNFRRFDTAHPKWMWPQSPHGRSTLLAPYSFANYDFYSHRPSWAQKFGAVTKGLKTDRSEVARLLLPLLNKPDDVFTADGLQRLVDVTHRAGLVNDALALADNVLFCRLQEATKARPDKEYSHCSDYDEIVSAYRRHLAVSDTPLDHTLIEARIKYADGLRAFET